MSPILLLPHYRGKRDDSFFVVMTESHKDTERQFEMTIPEDEADATTVLAIKNTIAHMLTPEDKPPLDQLVSS